jgi:peptidoglycan/xylan/chitin deacetylase (PgdA/CDA1 family)
VVLWSASGGVPGAATTDEIVQTTMNRLQPGAVVCLHDGVGRGLFNPGKPWADELMRLRRLEVQALPAVIAAIADRGMRCVTLSELVAAGDAAA